MQKAIMWLVLIVFFAIAIVGAVSVQKGPARDDVANTFAGGFQVEPAVVAAGGTISISGHCTASAASVLVSAFGPPQPPSQTQLIGYKDADLAANGDYSAQMLIAPEAPPGPWHVSASCGAGDTHSQFDEADIQVTGSGDYRPILVFASTVEAGQSLTVSGSGCSAEATSLEEVSVSLFARADQTPQGQYTSAQASLLDGRWSVDIPIPANFASESYAVTAQCQGGTSPTGVGWIWYVVAGYVAVLPAPVQVPPPTVTSDDDNALHRTG